MLSRRIAVAALGLAISAGLPGQEVKPKPTELEKLKQEAERLKAEVEAARQLAEAKAEVEKLKKDLADIKKGKITPKKNDAEIEIRPRWQPPNMRPGEITIVKDRDGVWWYFERRAVSGEVSTHEFRTEKPARDFAAQVVGTRTDLRFVSMDDLRKRPKPKK